METKFKSQICTTREQSERLLELGLKRETADMVLIKEMVFDEENHCTKDGEDYLVRPIDYLKGEEHRGHIPAWSLHRLIEMMPNELMYNGQLYRLRIDMGDQLVGYFPHPYRLRNTALEYFYGNDIIYDDCISCIEWLIKDGYFNEGYLNKEE